MAGAFEHPNSGQKEACAWVSPAKGVKFLAQMAATQVFTSSPSGVSWASAVRASQRSHDWVLLSRTGLLGPSKTKEATASLNHGAATMLLIVTPHELAGPIEDSLGKYTNKLARYGAVRPSIQC